MKQLLAAIALLTFASSVASAQEEVNYTLLTWILNNDSAAYSPGVPLAFDSDEDGNTLNDGQWRGVGQVINPDLMFPWYDSVYGENTGIFSNYFTASDQEYIEQFENARSYTVDSVRAFVFSRDPNAQNNSETLGSLVTFIRSNFDFTSQSYKTGGFHQSFIDMKGAGEENVLEEIYMTPGELSATFNSETSRITGTLWRFEPGALTFEPGESLIMMYWNPADPAYTGTEIGARIEAGGVDQRNFIVSQTEYATGHWINPVTQDIEDTRARPLSPSYKTLGLVLYRGPNGVNRVGNEATDTVHSNWTNLGFLQRNPLLNVRAWVWGTVELAESGVRYHFGQDAAEQGLGEVTPNPVSTDSRLPFSLSEKAHVTIEVYSMSGEKVATLIDDLGYMEGNYSVPLPVSSLENGPYVVRMTANENVYTMKFSVVK